MDAARRFASNEEALAWARTHMYQLPEGPVRDVAFAYTKAAREWNVALREAADPSRPPQGEFEEPTRLLDAAIEKSRLPESIVTIRSTSLREFVFPDGRRYPDHPPSIDELPGTVQVQHGYMSTAIGLDITIGRGNVDMIIVTPAGHPALFVEQFSLNQGEREIIQRRSTALFIHAAYEKPGSTPDNPEYIVEAEVIPVGTNIAALTGHPTMPLRDVSDFLRLRNRT
jgi:hypothetical protein